MSRTKKKSNNWQIIAIISIVIGTLYVIYHYDSKDSAFAQKPSINRLQIVDKELENEHSVYFNIPSLELPYYDTDKFIIDNKKGRYTMLYDTLYRQASWVAYVLTHNDVKDKQVKRKNKFASDPQVVAKGYPTAKTNHYTSSGYDRGHLCPSADRADSREANDNTFLLSNISPQRPALNRGIWKNLEEQTRRWAEKHDTLYVVTGGVLKAGIQLIAGGIGVPDYFYKALLTQSNGTFHAIAFIIPHQESYTYTWSHYAVSIDSLETMTAFDLFHNLPDNIEQRVESNDSLSFWTE